MNLNTVFASTIGHRQIRVTSIHFHFGSTSFREHRVWIRGKNYIISECCSLDGKCVCIGESPVGIALCALYPVATL